MAKILLIDDEDELRELVALGLQFKFNVDITEASSGNEARQILSVDREFDLIICDYSMPNGNGSVVLDYIEEQQIQIPFLFFTSYFSNQIPKNDLDRATALITKPCLDGSLDRYVESLLVQPKSNKSALPLSGYIRIRKKWVLSLDKAYADYHLKLSDKHYVLFIKNGVSVQDEAFERLRKKEDQFIYVQSQGVEVLLDEIIKKIGVQPDKKTPLDWQSEVSWMSEITELTHKLHTNLGWSREVEALTQKSLEHVERKMQELPALRDLLQKLKKQEHHRLYHHVTALTYISIGMLVEFKALKNYGDQELQSLAAAALIHDIDLDEKTYDRRNEFKEALLKNKKLVDESFLKYQDHSEIAAHVAAAWQGVSEDVQKIVLQHHERPDGNGFPFKVKGNEIAPLSCVFILAHELTDFILDEKNQSFDLEPFFEKNRGLYSEGLFRDLLANLRNAVRKS